MLANKQAITFNYSHTVTADSHTYDNDYTNEQFAQHGVHWRDDDIGSTGNRDGLFPQVVLDDMLVLPFPAGTAAHDLGRHASVFILDKNQRWRYLPNVDLYDKLLGNAPRGAVRVMTSWQFRHMKEVRSCKVL